MNPQAIRILLTDKQKSMIMHALPLWLLDKYESADELDKIAMTKELDDFLFYASRRADKKQFFSDTLNINI